MFIDSRKDDLRLTRTRPDHEVHLADGDAHLVLQRFGLSANNITYAVMGAAMNYWDFFPVPDLAEQTTWGTMPVWGFGSVSESRAPELAEGTRVFGYFPFGSGFVAQPGRFDESGFSDTSAHRAALPGVYNRLAYLDHDPLYSAATEAQLMLLRPLFITSFVVDDFLADNNYFGASQLIISSASSKTSIGTAFLANGHGSLRVVGVTSPTNLAFTRRVGCYDDVVTYDDCDALARERSVYVDVAGRRDITSAVHRHLGDHLAYSMVVGDTHWENNDPGATDLVGPHPQFLFAPDHIAKRRREWGREKFENAVASAWHRFMVNVATWMVVRDVRGEEALRDTYLTLLNGTVDPQLGFDCHFA